MVSMSNLLNGKDSRWLQLEVCREFQRNKCSRPDTECKFAHPPANVEVQNGRVTACYDSIKVSYFMTFSLHLARLVRCDKSLQFAWISILHTWIYYDMFTRNLAPMILINFRSLQVASDFSLVLLWRRLIIPHDEISQVVDLPTP